MAIDDNANYTLTGAQVKDLASKVKASDPLIIYTSAAIGSAFQTYSDDNLTVVITGAQIGAAFKAGRQIILTTDTILEPTATIVAFTEGPEDMFTCVVENTTYRYGYKSAQSRWVAVSRTVNDGTLTIQHNGTTVQTFTANQSTNATANIETIYADTIAPATPVAPITTDMIADGAITPAKFKGYQTANTGDTWVPVSTGTSEIQHRVIKPFNADGSIPPSAIDWGSFYVSATPLSGVVPLTDGTRTYIQQISLPAGKWRICWGYRVTGNMANTTQTRYFTSGISNGSNTVIMNAAFNATPDYQYSAARTCIAQSYETTLTATTTIKSFVEPSSPCLTSSGAVSPADSAYLYALRVG